MRALLLITLFWLPSAFARIETPGAIPEACGIQLLRPESYARIFYDAYPDAGSEHGLYQPALCGANTARLLMRLMMSAIKPLRADAVYMRHEMRKSPPVPVYVEQKLLPAYARRATRDTWFFHAVVMITDEKGERLILDMDYKREPVPVKDYFANMFPDLEKGVDRASKIFLRVVPGADYVSKFQKLGNGALKLELHDLKNTEYPLITARDLIATRH